MKSTIISILLFSLSVHLFAEEGEKIKFDKLLDYSNVIVTKIEPDGIRIMHESGAAKIPYERLPEDIRTKLGMSKASASDYRAEVLKQETQNNIDLAKQQLLDAASLIFEGTVHQVLDGGLLLRKVSYTDGTTMEEKKVPYKVQTGGPSGLHPNAKVTYETRYKTEWVLKVRTILDRSIYVECDTSGYADGDPFKGQVYARGVFTYNTSQGERKTVHAYTTDASKFLEKKGLESEKK